MPLKRKNNQPPRHVLAVAPPLLQKEGKVLVFNILILVETPKLGISTMAVNWGLLISLFHHKLYMFEAFFI